MLTEGGLSVTVGVKLVLAPGVTSAVCLIRTRARKRNKLVAPLVNHKTAGLALVALPSKPKDEVGAVAAEGGLLEDGGDELVLLHLVHGLLSQRPLAGQAAGHALRRRGVVGRGNVSHGHQQPPLDLAGSSSQAWGTGRRRRSLKGVSAVTASGDGRGDSGERGTD